MNLKLPDCLELATDREIRKCQNDFMNLLKTDGEDHMKTVGFQGGREQMEIWWFKKYKFWWSYSEAISRHWNAFGMADNMDDDISQGYSITCEINSPHRADNWQPRGRFCKDDKGRYYIAHTGHLNASGKRIKLDEYTLWPRTKICGLDRSVFVISALDDKNLIENVCNFVKTVQKIKEKIKSNSDEEREQLKLEDYLNKKSHKEIESELDNIEPISSEFIEITGKAYKRNNVVIALLKKRQDYKCQICQTRIRKKKDGFYIEAAHIKSKSEKGPENRKNILILCPNHHKEFDFGDRKIIKHSKNEIIFKLNGVKHAINL
ncbi:MAG: HNH endonuclease [Thaumarchaeota archaeon]|nr:HNH endonuclease [Nitrososphaerota archaeon]